MVRLHTRESAEYSCALPKQGSNTARVKRCNGYVLAALATKKRPHVQFFAVHSGEDKSAQKKEEIDSQETSVE
jgi:hypothetical protein